MSAARQATPDHSISSSPPTHQDHPVTVNASSNLLFCSDLDRHEAYSSTIVFLLARGWWPVTSRGSAGELTVGVVVGVAQQCAEPVDVCGAGQGQLVAGAEQDAQGFAVTVGPRNRQLAGVQTERGQDGEVGVDRVGFPLPRRALRWGCSHSSTSRPAAVAARASPMP